MTQSHHEAMFALLSTDGRPYYLSDDRYHELLAFLAVKPELGLMMLSSREQKVRISQHLQSLNVLLEYNRQERERGRERPSPDDVFLQEVLRGLKERLATAARRRGGALRSVLVLPAGKSFRIPCEPGIPPVDVRRRLEARSEPFGDRKIAPSLRPPRGVIPRQRPLTALEVPEGTLNPPDRLHLLSGSRQRLNALRDVIAGWKELRSYRALERLVFRSPQRLASDADQALDEWLCTLHWWMWKLPGLPAPCTLQTEFREGVIPVPVDSTAFRERQVFSVLPWDLLRVSTVVLAHLSALLGGGTGCAKAEIEFLTPARAGESAPPLLQLKMDTVTCGTNSLILQEKQRRILELLMSATKQSATREMLARHAWEGDTVPSRNTISQAVSKLRADLRKLTSVTEPIRTEEVNGIVTWRLMLRVK